MTIRKPAAFGIVCLALLIALTARESSSTETEKSCQPRAENASSQGRTEQSSPVPAMGAARYRKVARQAETEIRQKMQKRFTTELDQKPLEQFLRDIEEIGGFDVWMDKVELQRESIAPDKAITDSFDNVTIEQALNWVLQPFGLTWVIEDEVLKVTTVWAAQEKLYTRTCNVKTLLELAAGEEEARSCDDSAFFHPEYAHGCLDPGPLENWLTETCMESTAGPWFEYDGRGGVVSLYNDVLIVHQTQLMHEETASLLKALETVAKKNPKFASVPVRPATYPHTQDAAINGALTKKLPFHYEGVTLRDVAADIHKRAGIRVRIRKRALEKEGIGVGVPISVEIENVTLGSTLEVVLKPLGLTFYVEEGALWITTELEAEEHLYSVVYDVADLKGPQNRNDWLIELITQETTGPWFEVHGSGGQISETILGDGALVIRQTQRVHNEVAVLLADLREKIGEWPKKAEKEALDPDEVVTRFYRAPAKWVRNQDLENGDHQVSLADDALEAIPAIVAPDTWQEKGGAGVIKKVGDTLVVRQTVKVHRKLERFLSGFTQLAGGYGTGESFFAVASPQPR